MRFTDERIIAILYGSNRNGAASEVVQRCGIFREWFYRSMQQNGAPPVSYAQRLPALAKANQGPKRAVAGKALNI